MCVHHLWVESTVLNVIPLPEAGQTMADSSCAQNKNEKNAEIWKDKPQDGKHSSQKHKARERFNILVVEKTLESWCLLKGQMANTCTSNERQGTHHYMSEMPNGPKRDTCLTNIVRESTFRLSHF